MTNNNINTYEIKPYTGLIKIDFAELWRYRELFLILVWRDIKVRYKQTAIGIIWAVFQPLLTMAIFTVFFGRLARVPSDNIPYPIFVYSGLLLWNYYSTALTNSSNCLVENEGIVKKIYFPRLILPLSTTITPTIDFLIALMILFVLMIYYHFIPNLYGILLIPILLFAAFISALGLGVLFAAINVKYRDVRYALPFFIQIMMFITPVIYPVSIIPVKYQWLAYLNPMTGIVSLSRSTLLHTNPIDIKLLMLSLISSIIILIFGITFFRKTEKFFADIL